MTREVKERIDHQLEEVMVLVDQLTVVSARLQAAADRALAQLSKNMGKEEPDAH